MLVATAALGLLVVAFRRRVLAHAAYAGKALAVAAVVCLALVAWPLLVQFTGPGRPHTSIQHPAWQ